MPLTELIEWHEANQRRFELVKAMITGWRASDDFVNPTHVVETAEKILTELKKREAGK